MALADKEDGIHGGKSETANRVTSVAEGRAGAASCSSAVACTSMRKKPAGVDRRAALPCFQLRPAPRIPWARLAGPSGFRPLDHTGGQAALPLCEYGGAVL